MWLLALTAALGGLIFGYDIGGAGATFVMDGFKYHFGWACHPDDVGEFWFSDTRVLIYA